MFCTAFTVHNFIRTILYRLQNYNTSQFISLNIEKRDFKGIVSRISCVRVVVDDAAMVLAYIDFAVHGVGVVVDY